MSSSSSSPPITTPARRSGGDENSSSHTSVAAALRDVVDVVTPTKNDNDIRVDCGSGNNDYKVNNEEENLTEIKDLQNALEYLISDKRQSCLTNNNDDQEKPKGSSATSATAQHSNTAGVDANDETLCQIPNLVNRILVEHYSSLPPGQSHKRRDISYSARKKMTQLIIAVIVEFAEPYFVRKIGRRQEERLKLLVQDKGEQEPQEKKSKRRKGVEEDNAVVSSTLRFEDRAVSWATQCLKLLLQPSLSPSQEVQNANNNINNNKSGESVKNDLHIPELDALLAATGSNDGYEMEQRIQQSLLLGVQARSMFMSSYVGVAFEDNIIDESQR